jgi:hypothetical protein
LLLVFTFSSVRARAADPGSADVAKLRLEVKMLSAISELGLTRDQTEALLRLLRELDAEITARQTNMVSLLESLKGELLEGKEGASLRELDRRLQLERQALQLSLKKFRTEAASLLTASQARRLEALLQTGSRRPSSPGMPGPAQRRIAMRFTPEMANRLAAHPGIRQRLAEAWRWKAEARAAVDGPRTVRLLIGLLEQKLSHMQ